MQGRATCVRSRAEREWTKRALVGGAFSARRVIPYSKVVDGRGRQNERAWRILRQPARRVALWRAQYDSDKILPDLNVMTIFDGPLLAKAVVRRFSLTSIGGCQVSTASGELDATHLMIGPVLELPYCQ